MGVVSVRDAPLPKPRNVAVQHVAVPIDLLGFETELRF
jgi:hypothetical protein